MSDGTTASESAAQNSNRDENAVQMTFDWLPRQPVSVVDDLGPVGEGVSRSRHIAATDGNEYLIKGPELLPENPYGACNELLAWQIATSLRLPILDCTLVEWKQKIYFGSQWIARGAFQFMTENLLDQCGNRDIVYDLVAFDAYLINDDRHVHNLRARRERIQGGQDRLTAYLNDHDRVLLEPRRQPFHLKAFVTSRATDYTRIGFVRMAVRDPAMLSAAVQRIEELPDDIIRTGVRRIPGVWLDEHHRTLVEDFLLSRRDALRAAFNATPHAYTALQGGGI